MKKKVIVLLSVIILFSLIFTACDAKLRIRESNTAILRLTIFAEELGAEKLDDAYVNQILAETFDSDDLVNIEIKSYRINKNGHHIKIKIDPKARMYHTYEDGYAIGNAYRVFKEYALDNYKRANWRTCKDDLSEAMENETLYAFDKQGNQIDFYDVSRIMDSVSLRINKAVYIESGYDNMKVTLPGRTIISFSESKDLDQLTGRSMLLGSGAVLLIYKSNFWGIFIFIVLLILGGMIAYALLKHKKKNSISEESPQESVATYFCDNCGSPVTKTDKFCKKCGTAVKVEEA